MFENQTIDYNHLPKYEEVVLKPIHPEYKKIVFLDALVTLIVGLGISVAIYFIVDDDTVYTYFYISFVIALLIAVYNLLAYKKKCYAFRQHDVLYQKGLISTKTSIVPYLRLQHVVIKQGWYAKRLNLAKLQLHTAANDNVDITIPGLTLEEANHWKEFVLNKIQEIENEQRA